VGGWSGTEKPKRKRGKVCEKWAGGGTFGAGDAVRRSIRPQSTDAESSSHGKPTRMRRVADRFDNPRGAKLPWSNRHDTEFKPRESREFPFAVLTFSSTKLVRLPLAGARGTAGVVGGREWGKNERAAPGVSTSARLGRVGDADRRAVRSAIEAEARGFALLAGPHKRRGRRQSCRALEADAKPRKAAARGGGADARVKGHAPRGDRGNQDGGTAGLRKEPPAVAESAGRCRKERAKRDLPPRRRRQNANPRGGSVRARRCGAARGDTKGRPRGRGPSAARAASIRAAGDNGLGACGPRSKARTMLTPACVTARKASAGTRRGPRRGNWRDVRKEGKK